MTRRGSISLVLSLILYAECTAEHFDVIDKETAHYCQICRDHTMCLYPYDNESSKCIDIEESDFDDDEIETILRFHNEYRSKIASGLEIRGNPGPQPTAKAMMELIWDDELAHIARRWALQCNLSWMDQCRDVERFGVWQNVHVVDMDRVGGNTSTERIRTHIDSWHGEVESFDVAELWVPKFATRNHSSYVVLATAAITYVGCGRAIYTSEQSPWTSTEAKHEGSKRVETLVCNYGPVDRSATWAPLYETGVPGRCPLETRPSTRYSGLCENGQSSQNAEKKHQEKREGTETKKGVKNSATISAVASAVYLGQLLLLALPV